MHAQTLTNLIVCAVFERGPAGTGRGACPPFSVYVVRPLFLRAFPGCDCLQLRLSATNQQCQSNILASVLHVVDNGSSGSAVLGSCSLMKLLAL